MLSSNFKPKRTAAASRGFLATARLSCLEFWKSINIWWSYNNLGFLVFLTRIVVGLTVGFSCSVASYMQSTRIYSMFTLRVRFCLFQTQLPNGTYKQHSVEEETSVILTSYNGIFRIEVSYENLVDEDCISSWISYEFLPDSHTCIGKLLLCST